MRDIIEICDALEANKKTNIELEVVSARKMLKNVIGNDYNKLLQLEAEFQIHDNFNDKLLPMLGFLLSTIVYILTIIYNVGDKRFYLTAAIIYSGIIVLIIIGVNIPYKKNSARDKWLKFIFVALEDIKKDFDTNNSSKLSRYPKKKNIKKYKNKKHKKEFEY